MSAVATHRTAPAPVTAASPRLLFACGGTGGHVYPAIAIADAVRALAPAAVIAFAGTRERMEAQAVAKAGYAFHPITARGFQRGLSRDALARNLTLPYKLCRGLLESLRLIRDFDPGAVVATGGYAAGPVGLAAALRHRPLVLQEQNAYAGVTNRLLARFATRVFIAFEAARSAFPREKTLLAGNPVRAELTAADPAEARAHFGLEADGVVLLVTGGSLGAGPINEGLRASLEVLLADVRLSIIWQTGSRYFERLRAEVSEHPRLRLLPYLDRMDLAYAAADLALCRAGAITCSELAVTGTPSILVPSPNVTADHQTKNARALSEAGAAVLLPESRLAAELAGTVRRLAADAGARRAMREAALRVARPDAARTIAEALLILAKPLEKT